MATSCAQDVEAATRAAVTALCPGFRARGEPNYTETSMLLGGVLDGRAVIAKYPIDRRPFWLARARHEITVYRALPALAPLPVTVPDMVAADPRHPLIIITALHGVPRRAAACRPVAGRPAADGSKGSVHRRGGAWARSPG